MVTIEELKNCGNSLQKEIDSISPDICIQFPVLNYIKDVKSHLQLRTHSYFSYKRRRIFEKINLRYGSLALSIYHKLALINLMEDALEYLQTELLPERIYLEVHSWFRRIIDDFTKQPHKYYHQENIDFVYDLGVCCLKSLPIGGAWFVQVRRIGFRFFLTANTVHLLKKLWFIIFTMHGFSRYCVIHTYVRYLPRFNPQQLNLAYRNIGDLMKHNQKIRGIYRRSWFLDPKLETISPNLTYLREIPRQNGAIFFYAGSSEDDIGNALRFSPDRNKLYKEGKYSPRAYAFIWPRIEFLTWLNKIYTD